MTLRSIALSGAAALALAMGAAEAGDDPYTHNPTPDERAQTQGLNDRAAGQAVSDVDANDAAQQDYQAQQQQYQAQQQQYQNDQAHYQAQQERYQDRDARYRAEHAEYYDRTHPTTWWHERYERATLNHFYDIPRAELVDLRVMRGDGYTVGRIREIDRHGDGRVEAVRIVFRDGESGWVKARHLRYDPDNQVVFTDLTIDELHDLAHNS
jgi:hypothetical protein